MTDPARWVRGLAEPGTEEASLVGGKAARLSRMRSAGLPVPDAFVITVGAFRAHCPEGVPPPARPELATDFLRSLDAAFDRYLGQAPGPVAVRSSATGEDGAAASFAGQHATYYYVSRAGLGRAVVDCWLSLWSERARAYRAAHGPDGDGAEPPGMAVIVQRMIQADRSGVCFTEDPTGRHPGHRLIESTWGLGAALVDGRVSPDRFLVGPGHRIRTAHIGRKRFKVAENLDNPSGNRLEPVPAHQQGQASLSEGQVRAVARLAERAAELFAGPQDVEWAVERDELYVLQSRPITGAVEPAPAVDGRWVVFKPLVENFHEPLSPMTADLFRRVIPPFGQFIRGRYYLDVDVARRLIPLDLSDPELGALLLLRGGLPRLAVRWRGVPAAVGIIGAMYLTGGMLWHRSARLAPGVFERFAELARRLRDDPRRSALDTLVHLFAGRHPFEPIGHRAFQVNISAGRYFLLLGALKHLLGRWAPQYDQSQVATLCSGDEAMLSRQMIEAVRGLAAEARADEAVRSALADTPVNALSDVLLTLPEAHPFVLRLEAFLKRFGHRCVREMDLISPRWREDPSAVLAMVRSYLQSEPAAPPNGHGLRLAAQDELHGMLRPRWRRWIADYLVRRIRYYVTLRENTRHYHTMAFEAVRAKLKRLEQELIHDGRLRCADDVFFLHWDEARALAAGRLSWPDVEPLIRARRQRHQRESRTVPPETFNLELPAPARAGDQALVGECASPGIAEGVVRVVTDPTLGAALAPGEILVAPYTDPAWTPLFPNAAAVIVEVGSYLSHAGTVAREYHIPCLVDVADCTRLLTTGQRVRVCAAEGRVEILK